MGTAMASPVYTRSTRMFRAGNITKAFLDRGSS
jgi:hypothetical protein